MISQRKVDVMKKRVEVLLKGLGGYCKRVYTINIHKLLRTLFLVYSQKCLHFTGSVDINLKLNYATMRLRLVLCSRYLKYHLKEHDRLFLRLCVRTTSVSLWTQTCHPSKRRNGKPVNFENLKALKNLGR